MIFMMLSDAKSKKMSLVVGVLSLSFISLMGQKYPQILQYDRSAIIDGQFWRILTCHFVHTGWEHLFSNFIGAMFLFCLFHHLYSLFVWLLGSLCCMIGISLSFLYFWPALDWYRGLSGLLHALLMIGIIGEIKNGNKLFYLGLLAIIGKLATERFTGPADFTSRFINANVITAAHLSGAIIGGMTGCIMIFIHNLLTHQSFRIKTLQAE